MQLTSLSFSWHFMVAVIIILVIHKTLKEVDVSDIQEVCKDAGQARMFVSWSRGAFESSGENTVLHRHTNQDKLQFYFVVFSFSFINRLVSVFSLSGTSDSSRLAFASRRRPLQVLQRGFLEAGASPPGKSQEAPIRKRHLQLEPVAVTVGSPMWSAGIQTHNCKFTALNSLLGFHSFPFLTVFQKQERYCSFCTTRGNNKLICFFFLCHKCFE